jgi:nucleoid-associated protein YgaU
VARNTEGRGGGGHLAGRLAAGLAAFAALAAALVGLPYVLIRIGANPLPDHVPSVDEVWTLATSPDNGQLFLGALAVVAWVAWATFVLSILVEIPAQLTGRRTLRLPGLGMQQRLAAVLIAAVIAVVLSPAVSANASTGGVGAPAPSVVAVQIAGPVTTLTAPVAPPSVSPSTAAQAATPAPSAAGSTIVHTVRSGESLLSLAEQYHVSLESLAGSNYGIAQPDGRSLRPGEQRIYPGWELRVPVSAPGYQAGGLFAPRVAQAPQAQTVYEVVRGDWLGCIAERYLGDFDRYTEIASLNPGLIRNPNHIEPTWRLTLPADAFDRGPQRHATGAAVSPAAQPAPGTDSQAQTPAPQTSSPPTQAPQVPVPQTPPAQTPTTAPTPVPAIPPAPAATAAPTPAATATPGVTPDPTTTTVREGASTGDTSASGHVDGSDSAQADDDVVKGAMALGAAGLLAALAFAAMVAHRRQQRQHHQPGQRALNPQEGRIETELRVAQYPLDVERLDAALRSLSAGLLNRPGPLPDPVGAIVDGGSIRLLLAAACPNPPLPWLDHGDSWSLATDAVLAPYEGRIALLPSLAAVGAYQSTHLLLDLERIGFLIITGDAERRADLIRYLSSELALNAWSDDVEIIVAGFPAYEAGLLVAINPDRVRALDSVTDAVIRVDRRVASATNTLANAGVTDALAGRVSDVAADAWMPQVLIVAEPDDAGLLALQDLVVSLENGGRCAVGVVVATRPDVPAFGRWSIHVDADGTLGLPFPLPYPPLRAAGLPLPELERLAEIMQTARDRTETPVPPAAELERWAAGTDAAGGVLGLFGGPTDDEDVGHPDTEDLGQDTSHEETNHEDISREDTNHEAYDPPAYEQEVGPALTNDDPDGVATMSSRVLLTTAVAAEETRPRVITAAVRQRRPDADPELDADLAAWRDADPGRPRLAILGPVTVDAPGPLPEQRQRFHAEIIVYLAQRGARGADRDQLDEALWPDRNVKDASRRVAITRARRWLGETAEGEAWLPDMGADRSYRLREGYLLDWHLFRRLRTRGELNGSGGANDLRAALELVRGVALEGADRPFAAGARSPYTWLAQSDIHPDHIASAVIDTAHHLALLNLEIGDAAGARWAVAQAWLADPGRGYDQPWRDLMLAQHLQGQFAELHTTFAELMQVRDAEVPEDLEPETFQVVLQLLPDVVGAATSAR